MSHVAVYVRGVWVARSDLLYLNDPRLSRAHDLLLLALHEKGSVVRKNFVDSTNLSAEDAKYVLLRVAKLEVRHGIHVVVIIIIII